ncbi:MAG: hypothetical protein ABIV51_06750 [Saprospiraceae bacterium]
MKLKRSNRKLWVLLLSLSFPLLGFGQLTTDRPLLTNVRETTISPIKTNGLAYPDKLALNLLNQGMTSTMISYKQSPEAFFCKKEMLMDRQNKVQFRFRLGSAAYVNYLEGKPGYSVP